MNVISSRLLQSVSIYQLASILIFLIIFGLPIESFWTAVGFFFFLLAIISVDKIRKQGIGNGVFIALVVLVLVRYLIPEVHIQEGHNLYLEPDGPAQPEYTELPQEVNAVLIERFQAAYPYDKRCSATEYGCWRSFSRGRGTYAFSSSSVWQQAFYSRVVTDINFTSVKDFNGGFLNNRPSSLLGDTNWYDWISDIKRKSMPFFVMYEIPQILTGSRLCWKGEVLWGGENNTYEDLKHVEWECRTIKGSDVGNKVYGLNISPEEQLGMKLEPTPEIVINRFVRVTIQLAAAALLLSLFTYRRHRLVLLTALGLASIIYLLSKASPIALSSYPLGVGGSDGLTYIGYGHYILYAATQGMWIEALRGLEDIYYFMPGARYFWAFSNLLFGDTNIGYLFVTTALLTVVPLIALSVAPRWLAVILIIGFYSKGFGVDALNEILVQSRWAPGVFLRLMEDSSAEILGYAFFLFALYIFVSRPNTESLPLQTLLLASLLAMAVIIRPNIIIGAFLFVGYIIWKAARNGRWSIVSAACAGISMVGVLPLHNLYFGHKFVPLTASADIDVNLHASPTLYYHAIKEYIGLLPGEDSIQALSAQWGLWLPTWWSIFLLGVLIVGMIFTRNEKLRAIGYAAIGLQIPLMFWTANGRYADLAWLLTFLFGVVVLVDLYRQLPDLGRFMRRVLEASNSVKR